MSDDTGNRLRLDLQTITALSAVVVGVAALFVAWEESRIMRAQQFAAAMPIVQADFDAVVEAGSSIIRIRLRNDGLGPAFVKSGRFRIGEAEIETYRGFREALLSPPFSEIAPNVRLDATRGVLAPGVERTALAISWADEELIDDFVPFAFSLVAEDAPELSYEVCFCSVYEQCWITDIFSAPQPEEVKACSDDRDIYTTFMTETN